MRAKVLWLKSKGMLEKSQHSSSAEERKAADVVTVPLAQVKTQPQTRCGLPISVPAGYDQLPNSLTLTSSVHAKLAAGRKRSCRGAMG